MSRITTKTPLSLMSRIVPLPSCSSPSGRFHEKDAGARSRYRLDFLSSTVTPTNGTLEYLVDMEFTDPCDAVRVDAAQSSRKRQIVWMIYFSSFRLSEAKWFWRLAGGDVGKVESLVRETT